MASGSSYLVPIGKSPARQQALELACRLAGATKSGRVHVVYVVEVNRRLPLDADLPQESEEGERIIANAERVVRKHKVGCDGEILQARDTGHAIVDEAVELAVDAIVLDAPRRGRPGGPLALGKTADYVLRNAPCDVIVVRSSRK